MSEWRKRAAEGVSPGDRFSFSRAFSLGEVAAFGELTRDYNPVHYDDAFAGLKGFRAPVCHGLLAGSMICQIGGQLGWLATGMQFAFKKPVYPGDTITCELTVDGVDASHHARAHARLSNQDGVEVMTAALEGYLPAPAARDRLNQMMEDGDPTNPLRDRRW
jgi:3-hydroxybutyryl-CoA dehydratase